MRINLARSRGFCFGVRRALDIALKTARLNRSVYMLGDIVHNEEVVKELQSAGIKKIKKLFPAKGKILLIRAHGSCLKILRQARKLGFKIVDATCPRVKEIHKIAIKFERNGYPIIIIGDKNHDEVHGIIGHLKNKPLVIDRIKNIPFESLRKIKKACVVVQSTQDLQKTLEIVKHLKNYIPKLKFFNTICQPTRIKQQEIRTLPLENDVVIIVGSKSSANTRRLYEISQSINPRSFWVSSARELKRHWFKDAKNIAVTAGASTPDSTTQDIINYIRKGLFKRSDR
ncbi:MAG: 4-hydroxy-3-methylbut-2-enyl diphosphate reductase [Candidatus Omnitrophica bacterium]|nr:4-hydroxy-3-methylbut-2-enyl diphosphate reductase [Candidatus Omnitrophota bacterium]